MSGNITQGRRMDRMTEAEIKLPEGVLYVMGELERAGYRADIVGGSVRDYLLGKAPSDYDITTSATPEEIKEVFKDRRTVDTGIQHGTVTVLVEGEPYEVTTYRIDGEYEDSRHPVSVSFTKRIEEDLARRDFTVNAMAYNEKDGLTDAFGGLSDLKNCVIRAVGNPELRFTEDALRIFRAIRFSAVLGFTVEEETASALREKKSLLKNVSGERITVEWRKLLAGSGSYSVLESFSEIPLEVIPELSPLTLPEPSVWNDLTPEERELALFARSTGTVGFVTAQRRLKSDGTWLKFGKDALKIIENPPRSVGRELCCVLIGNEDSVALSALKVASLLGMIEKEIYSEAVRLIEANIPRKLSMLAFSGEDAMSLGLSGKSVGLAMNEALILVATGECENKREVILERLSDMKSQGAFG